MPKQKRKLSPAEQQARFAETVRELVDAGELNPTDAAQKMDAILGGGKIKKPADS